MHKAKSRVSTTAAWLRVLHEAKSRVGNCRATFLAKFQTPLPYPCCYWHRTHFPHPCLTPLNRAFSATGGLVPAASSAQGRLSTVHKGNVQCVLSSCFVSKEWLCSLFCREAKIALYVCTISSSYLITQLRAALAALTRTCVHEHIADTHTRTHKHTHTYTRNGGEYGYRPNARSTRLSPNTQTHTHTNIRIHTQKLVESMGTALMHAPLD